MTAQSDVNAKNMAFWDDLCGSQLARSLGVVDSEPASLDRFDKWYFNFYPYLEEHIKFNEIAGKDVLEVGLGYGSVAQRIAATGARYTGLDIAENPVKMVNHRLFHLGLPSTAQRGSILEAPFSEGQFDVVVAIGCLHHTGNLQRAISECHRILRPGGRLIFMVYYAYSYRRFWHSRAATFGYILRELAGYRGVVGHADEQERAAYDTNKDGSGAPHTDWISVKSLRVLCGMFPEFAGKIENIDNGPPFSKARPREDLLKTRWPGLIGLDLYATARK